MTIRFHSTGSGPAVLLVHAGIADARMWSAQVADLSTDHQVITVDLRGYGETPLEPGAKYYDADDLLACLDELGLNQVAAVGASYGGYVVQQAASKQPERFNRLVLLCAPTDGVEPTDTLRALWAEEGQLLDAGDVDGATALIVQRWLGPSADAEAKELLRVMQKRAYELQIPAGDTESEEYPLDLANVTAPTLVVTGAHDDSWFQICARKIAAELPNATHQELPWAGHLPALERPAEITALIRAAL